MIHTTLHYIYIYIYIYIYMNECMYPTDYLDLYLLLIRLALQLVTAEEKGTRLEQQVIHTTQTTSASNEHWSGLIDAVKETI